MNGRHGTFFGSPRTNVLLPSNNCVLGCFVGPVSYMCTILPCATVMYQGHFTDVPGQFQYVPGQVQSYIYNFDVNFELIIMNVSILAIEIFLFNLLPYLNFEGNPNLKFVWSYLNCSTCYSRIAKNSHQIMCINQHISTWYQGQILEQIQDLKSFCSYLVRIT